MKPSSTNLVLRSALFLTTLSYVFPATRSLAEGTRQVMTVSTNGTGLIVSTTTTFPLGSVGSYLGAPVDDRIYFRIKDYTTESLYYGFNWETLAPATPINTYTDVYMIIYDPTGAQVGAPIHLPSSNGNPGWINSYPQATAGPMINGAPGTGYTPLVFTPSMNGDYYVSFYRSSDGGNTHIAGGESMLAKYFDLTVAAYLSASNSYNRITGRVHCNKWAFSVYNPSKNDIQDPLSSTNAIFYGYTPDSVTVKVYFPSSGYEPLSFIVAFNSFGCINTGNWPVDRQSIKLTNIQEGPYLAGGYPVFLNIPDATIWPTSSIPSPPSLIDPVISGCPPGPYNVRFKAPQPGDYYMLFDLNGITGYQPNSADRFIELDGQMSGVITYVWDGKDGLGNQVPANTTFPIKFYYRKGRVNVPMYDDELNINGFSVAGVQPATAISTNPAIYWDDTQVVDTGSDCSNNNYNTTGSGYNNSIVGVTPSATMGRAWSGNGNPTNVIPAPSVTYGWSGQPNNTDQYQCDDYGNARLLNSWFWGINDSATQMLTLTCISVAGTVWDDADGSAKGTFTNIQTNNEKGTNAGAAIYASLVDPVTDLVLSTMPVNPDGTFILYNCPANSNGMLIYLTNTPATVGSTVPSAAIPAGWTNTSPVIHPFNSGTTPLTGEDFGIEQPPASYDQNYTIAMPILNSLLPLNGAGTVASPGPLTGSDPEDGTLGAGRSVVITSVPGNEQLYYNGTLLTNNYTITNYNPALLQVKFTTINSVVSTSFTYAYLDAASVESTPATYTINTSVVLEATLTSFNGAATDAGNVLTWTSADETRNMTFIIDRSTDGISFAPIGQVAATGDNTTVSHSFTDNSPTPNTPAYYRLEWTDGKGDVAYSDVVTIINSLISGLLDVSPNPFHDQVTARVSLSHAEGVFIRLIDSKGTVLRQARYQGVAGLNTFAIDGSALPPSVYFVQIVLSDKVFVRKVFSIR